MFINDSRQRLSSPVYITSTYDMQYLKKLIKFENFFLIRSMLQHIPFIKTQPYYRIELGKKRKLRMKFKDFSNL